MEGIRDRLGLRSASDAGFSLIEVMVAMFIFAVVATGLIYTMISVMVVTRDSRVRQVAANLAAQEIDLARDIEDVANFGGATRTAELNGDTFTIDRKSTWVTNPDTTLPSCGTSGGTLRYKQIHVEVTWGGMRGDTGVISDTLINPNERVTHPDFGTIMVTVRNTIPAGYADVTVSARAKDSSPTSTVIASGVTDANGCAYMLKVPPGFYDLTIQGAHGEKFIATGGGEPKKLGSAVAGEASAVLFEVVQAATLDIDYEHNGSTVDAHELPKNFGTSLVTSGSPQVSARATNPTFPKIAVVPNVSTTPVAGDAFGCFGNDPAKWPETSTWGAGQRVPAVTPEPGQTVAVSVPVRLVEVSGVNNRAIRAISKNSGVGCTTPIEYNFDARPESNREIALPYGYWDLQSRSGTGSWSTIPASGISVDDNDSKSGSTVVLEPRMRKP